MAPRKVILFNVLGLAVLLFVSPASATSLLTSDGWQFSTVPAAASAYLTDLGTVPPGDNTTNLPVAAKMPMKVLIDKIRIRVEGGLTGSEQVVVFVDKNNVGFNTGMPPSHQVSLLNPCPTCFGNWAFYNDVCSYDGGDAPKVEKTCVFDRPIVWDRRVSGGAPRDRLGLDTGLAVGGRIVSFDMHFIQDPNDADTLMQSVPVWQASAWPPLVGTPTSIPAWTGETGSYAGYTFAVAVAPSQINSLPSATQTRVAIQAGSSGASITDLHIGTFQAGGLPTDATNWTALGSVTIPANGIGQLAAAIDLTSGAGYVVKGYVVSGNLKYTTTFSGYQAYYSAGNIAMNATGGSYTTGAAAVGLALVDKLITVTP